MTPRERAIRAIYGPHCILADVEPGAMTKAVEAQIIAAIAVERELCIAIVKRWFGGDSIDDAGYECVREIRK